MSPPPSLHSSIHLYHANLRQTGWWELVRLLSAEERRRADAFAFERDARRFIVSHAVLRTLVGYATGIPPRELSFRREPGLKPVLKASLGRPFHFSLSRSEELVLIGLASCPLGVDIEWLGKTVDTEVMGDLVLSDRERETLRQLAPSDRQRAFLQCWTQKEAYLKATGRGLYVSPATAEVCFSPSEAAGLKSTAGNSLATARWFVNLVEPREGYIGALAILGDRRQVQLTAFDTSCLVPESSPGWRRVWRSQCAIRGKVQFDCSEISCGRLQTLGGAAPGRGREIVHEDGPVGDDASRPLLSQRLEKIARM
jgi:4'-phosphopantetheinyl transferase